MVRIGAFALLLSATFASLVAAASERPNVIVMVADDLGWADVGFHGNPIIETPALDRIAAEGVQLNRFYTTPICSPTRAALMTGRDPIRLGVAYSTIMPWQNNGIHPQETFLPELFLGAGYQTAMVGKWHLGYLPQFHPLNRGFDEYFGVLAGGSIFIDQSRPDVESIGNWPLVRDRSKGVYDGRTLVEVEEYLTDVFTDRAVDFIKQKHTAPFFLYLSHTTPHTPLQATKKYTSRYQHISDPAARILSLIHISEPTRP